ncbi:MAG: hypothetical protein AB7V53_09820, partial [Dongiaceae bacterium]
LRPVRQQKIERIDEDESQDEIDGIELHRVVTESPTPLSPAPDVVSPPAATMLPLCPAPHRRPVRRHPRWRQ